MCTCSFHEIHRVLFLRAANLFTIYSARYGRARLVAWRVNVESQSRNRDTIYTRLQTERRLY